MQIMKVDEFCMFVHGPFATNIYIDTQEVQKLKNVIARQPLSLLELNILKSLRKKKKTKDQLIKDLTQDTKITPSDVSSALKSLMQNQPGYVEKNSRPLQESAKQPREQTAVEDQRRFLKSLQESISYSTNFLKRPAKDFFSITPDGEKKLEETDKEYHKTYKDYYEQIDPNSEEDIAKENYLSRSAIDQFWSEVNAERNMWDYRFLNILSLDQDQGPLNQEESFFTDEDLPVLLAMFAFPDFGQKLSIDGNKVYLECERNTIYVYPTGVGIFSSEVTVRYSGDINKIKCNKHELEREVNRIIWDYFKNQGSKQKINKLNNVISHGSRFKLVDIEYFKLESARVASPAWKHTIYWFYGDNFFEEDKARGTQILTDDSRRDFTDLLEQSPKNMIFLQNRLVFYGWARSLILTDKPDKCTKEWERTKHWVRSRVKLLEVGQYSAFGYILLDHLLQRVLLNLTTDEPLDEPTIVDQPDKDLKKKIELIDNIRLAMLVFLEEFRSGIKIIFHASAPYLAETLEGQWRLDKVEESVRNKLESLHNERSAREQSLITQKQDRMNLVALAFTIIGIASVTSAIFALYPLEHMFEPEANGAFSLDELKFFIIITIIIIGLVIATMFRWHEIKHKLYRRSSWKYMYDYKQDIRDLYLKLAEEGYDDDEEHLKLGALKRKIKDLFDKGKINKSQYEKLMKEFERY
jgi:hypothetical protein